MLRASFFDSQPWPAGDREPRHTRGGVSTGPTEARAFPYATTSYEADEDGTLNAVLPTRCVYATGEQTCAIFVDHYRERKTGPCHPVAVVGAERTVRQHPVESVPGRQKAGLPDVIGTPAIA